MKSKRLPWCLASCLSLLLMSPTAFAQPPRPQPQPLKPQTKPVDPRWNQRKVLHLLDRISFGPTAQDVASASATGIDRYLDAQLDPDSIPEPPELTRQLAALDTLHETPAELFSQFAPPKVPKGQKQDPEVERKARERSKLVVEQAMKARFLRDLESPRQLQEVMVDFWFNHFNIYFDKGPDRLWIGSFEEQAIRPNALGRFRDLLEATIKHPAMLFYLDNWQNVADGKPGPDGRYKGLNENYARELMELHTLGVDGGYTQQDVISLARMLTGWGMRRYGDADGNSFYFNYHRHDYGNKQFLGQTIVGTGMGEGVVALDMLASSPATANHLCYQLAQYFVSDDPPASLVDRLAKRYVDSDGDIKQVLRTLFHSPEFWNGRNFDNKFKTPYQYVLSALRAKGQPVENFELVHRTIRDFGEPLYGCLTPDGYKNTQDAWLSPDAMTRRLSFAFALANGRMPFGSEHVPANAQQLYDLFDPEFSPQTRQAMATTPTDMRAAMILGSPEFMRR